MCRLSVQMHATSLMHDGTVGAATSLPPDVGLAMPCEQRRLAGRRVNIAPTKPAAFCRTRVRPLSRLGRSWPQLCNAGMPNASADPWIRRL